MSNGEKSRHVTQREFYSAFSLVWVYIMLLAGEIWRIEERWTIGLLAACSCLMVFVCTFQALRLRREIAPSEISEPAKELARDPARKIEAIKLHREQTGADLAEAKQAVESFIDNEKAT